MAPKQFIKFDVFGKSMSITWQEYDNSQGEWLLFRDSGTGLRSRIFDVIIPAEIEEPNLGRYLDDIFHENATEKHSQVIRLN